MAVITRQYGRHEGLIRLAVDDVLILNSPSGPLYAKAVPGGTCADCCMDTDLNSTTDNSCMKYSFTCSGTGMFSVSLKWIYPDQIVEELL